MELLLSNKYSPFAPVSDETYINLFKYRIAVSLFVITLGIVSLILDKDTFHEETCRNIYVSCICYLPFFIIFLIYSILIVTGKVSIAESAKIFIGDLIILLFISVDTLAFFSNPNLNECVTKYKTIYSFFILCLSFVAFAAIFSLICLINYCHIKIKSNNYNTYEAVNV